MITKAIIINKIEDTPNKFLVRIPLFEGSGNSCEVSGNTDMPFEATLCYNPGNYDSYLPNDIVYVSFEDNLYANAVILGKLYTGEENKAVGSQSINTLNVEGTTNLNGNVKVNGVDLSKINQHNQAINNLTDITSVLQSEMPDIELGDWIIRNKTINLNFFRKRS